MARIFRHILAKCSSSAQLVLLHQTPQHLICYIIYPGYQMLIFDDNFYPNPIVLMMTTKKVVRNTRGGGSSSICVYWCAIDVKPHPYVRCISAKNFTLL